MKNVQLFMLFLMVYPDLRFLQLLFYLSGEHYDVILAYLDPLMVWLRVLKSSFRHQEWSQEKSASYKEMQNMLDFIPGEPPLFVNVCTKTPSNKHHHR